MTLLNEIHLVLPMQGSRGSEQLEQLYSKTKKYRETVGKVLSKIFAKQFPHGIKKVTIDDLLKWDMWPVCISIYSEYCICMHVA